MEKDMFVDILSEIIDKLSSIEQEDIIIDDFLQDAIRALQRARNKAESSKQWE